MLALFKGEILALISFGLRALFGHGMRASHFCRELFLSICITFFFLACTTQPKPSYLPSQPKPSIDRSLAQYLSDKNYSELLPILDSLIALNDKPSHETGIYWKVMYWIDRDKPDSAMKMLANNKGKWSSNIRQVHATALQSLIQDLNFSRLALARRQADGLNHPAPEKSPLDKTEILQRVNALLRAEITKLESQKHKYKELIKDLETIQ